jgi:2-C-methyl-D-erythritol 2,4-cyclodiphosphate synthase
MAAAKTRIGFGYDIHRLLKGRKLVLGGVTIPHQKGLLGHSDADALCHAVADSLLGAAALGDIGQHFPNSAPEYKGISSLLLLAEVGSLLKKNKYGIVNIDSMVIAEKPQLVLYIDGMRKKIAGSLGLKPGQVSVKATTNEGLGPVGKGQGICAYSVALLEKL